MQTKHTGWHRVFLCAVLFVGIGAGPALGGDEKPASPASSLYSPLPYPKALQPQVEFWTKIFSTYSEYQVVIHDAVHLDKVYAVLDFRPLLKKHSKAKVRQLKSKRTKQELRKIRAALRKLHTHGAKGRTLSTREKKIRALFRDVKERHKFRKAAAKGRLRAQSGIRERFQESLRLSGRYLPRMEKIFRQKGLPVVLTRLPLIESSFNIEAYSKVGAAGIWQFMPATGRLMKLTINHVVDERLDPIIATRAAADLLKSNYDKLQTWPLAVTAYNHGPAGMARAVRKVGTRDIVPIIRRYKSRTFGFASRNFYAELLAAIEVEKNSEKYFGPITRDPLLWYDEVTLKHFVSLANLADAAGTSTERLVALNPSFGPLIRKGEFHVPRGHRLRIPAGARKDFDRRYAALSPRVKADRQVAALTHTVRRGETLGGIAQRYRTSVRTLQRLNGLRSANFIRIGQELRVSLRGKGRRPVRLAQGAAQDGTHIVRWGESLDRIARRYNTTVAALQKLNGIKNAALIRVGTKLRVSANSQNAGGKATQAYVEHTVRRGQTLGSIARRYGTKVSILKRLNGVKNVKRLQIGQVLRIPTS